jgi:hypothetical protein
MNRINYHHAVVAVLIVTPLLMAALYLAVAYWGESPAFMGTHSAVPYAVAGLACVVWSALYRSKRAHAYLGSMSALVSMMRVMDIVSHESLSTNYVNVVIWVTFSVTSLMVSFLGVEYVLRDEASK